MSINFDPVDVEEEEIDNEYSSNYKVPKRHTNFHIVFNTNQRENSLHSHQIEKIKTDLKNMCIVFAQKYAGNYVVLNEVARPGNMTGIPLEERILDKSFEYVVEIGPKRGLIHAHMTIMFAHKALSVQYDTNGAKARLRKIMNMPNAYVYFKTERSATERLADYVRKTIHHYE